VFGLLAYAISATPYVLLFVKPEWIFGLPDFSITSILEYIQNLLDGTLDASYIYGSVLMALGWIL